MSPEGVAVVLVAVGTFVSGLVLAYRGLSGDRFTRKATEGASLLAGYGEMVKNLRTEMTARDAAHTAEIDRQQRQHRTELDSLALLHKEERERWAEDRARMNERIELLEAQVAAFLLRPGGGV